MTSASFDVHVEELVLHGFEPRSRYRVGGTVERELERLLAAGLDGGVEARRVDFVDAGSFELDSSENSTEIGVRVARAAYGAVVRGVEISV
jgi:hypothetical protein